MHRYFFLVFLLCGVSFGKAQPPHQVQIAAIEQKNFPSTGFVNGVEDDNGLLWFAPTYGPLYGYDGVHFIRYPMADLAADRKNNVALFKALDGYIWLVRSMVGENEHEIIVFDPERKVYFPLEEYLEEVKSFNKSIKRVQQYQDGTIALTTIDQDIYEYDGKTIQPFVVVLNQEFKVIEAYPRIQKISDSIYSITRNHQVEYWSIAGELLQKQQFLEDIHNSDGTLAWLTKDSIRVLVKGYNDAQGKDISQLFGLGHPPKKLLEGKTELDNINDCYTYQAYLFVTKVDSLIVYDTNMNLVMNCNIEGIKEIILFDSQGGIWYKTRSNKLYRLHIPPKYFEYFACKPSEFSFCPKASRGILEGIHKDLLVTQSSHILHLDSNGTRTSIHDNKRRVFGDLFGLALSKDKKSIWAASAHKIWKINPNQISDYHLFSELPPAHCSGGEFIWIPYEDNQGKLWIGGSNQLFYINQKDSSTVCYLDEGIPPLTGSVFYFYENKEGMWICTANGLFLMNTNTQKIIYVDTSFQSPIVHLKEDLDGTFWLATKGNGLIHWDKKQSVLEQFDKTTGLEDNILYAVYQDSFERLWLPSNNGLICFDKKTKSSFSYGLKDGLPSLEFNTISHYQGAAGKLYFGGVSGTIAFDPNAIPPIDHNFSLLVSAFSKWDKEDNLVSNDLQQLISTNHIYFYPEDKQVVLSFALNSYNNAADNAYAYKIEGFDKNWTTLKEPTIKINALPYGDYQLRLRAKAAHGYWQEKSFSLYVTKPIYLQWWFILVVIVSISLLIFWLMKWRIHQLQKAKLQLEKTVLERTQKITQQTEELKKLDKLKSRFFANISHEFRTPLTLILGPTSSLQNKPRGMLSEKEMRENMQLITQNGKYLLRLVEEVLDLSKLDAQKLAIHLEPKLLFPFVNRIFSAFESLSKINAITYTLTYEASKDLIVKLDTNKLERILNNFINNAFKFTARGGKIEFVVQEKEKQLLFMIKDTGKGIDKEDLPQVFERFFQSNSPNLEAQGGTGLGLAVCREFAHLLNGSVTVQSELGVGSCFCCTLPKLISNQKVLLPKEEEPSAYQTEAAEQIWQPPAQKSHTLLLVEDNLTMQNFICSVLSPFYTILKADNGWMGLQQLEQNYKTIDLILSDVMMPEMNGFTMLEQIKQHDYWKSIPFIMLTARAAEQDKINALTIGANDYLLKPFSTNELLARIHNLLKNYEQRKLWHQELMLVAKQQQTTIDKKESLPPEDIVLPVVTKPELQWLKEIEQHITTHLNQADFNVETLATQVFLSKKQLERKIKHITGLTPAKLIKEVRLQKARNHLEQGDFETVTDVSFAVGFQTTKYFVRVYKERFGKAPKEYFW